VIVYFYCKSCDFVGCYVNDDEPTQCPECGSRWYVLRFGKGREDSSVNIDGTSRGKERYSSSMGCNPHEVEKFKKLYPGSEYTPDGRLVIQNRQHKKSELKRRGYNELD